jgi:lysophospholipid acyltransferase (LPLAT)-like uncharacterized protein
MKLRNPRLIRVVAFLAAFLVRAWIATLRVRSHSLDRRDHPLDIKDGPCIYAFWHETLLAPLNFRTRAPWRVLISTHADGELIAQICRHLGVGTVRGSTTRGGGPALVALWDCQDPAHLLFHPDGPRGPRRKVHVGMVALASKTGFPIIGVGVEFRRAWRAKSWDRFAVPWPFTQVSAVIAEPIHVPQDLDRAGLESVRALAEDRMLEATEAAGRWALGGEPIIQGPHRRPSVAGVPHRADA